MVQLKLLQRLGYFPMLVDVPPVIIDHIRTAMRDRTLPRKTVARYDVSGTRIRHQKLLRSWPDIRAFDAAGTTWLSELAAAEAGTKTELPDIFNVLIEELIRRRYELPPLATLQRLAVRARNDGNEAIYGAIASFLKHIDEIRKLAEGSPVPPAILSVRKRTQLVTEARALDVAELRSLKTAKRHALAVLFIQAQLQKAPDDVAEIFIKVMRKFESYAQVRLQKYQLEHADVQEGLVGQFRDVLQIPQDEDVPKRQRLPKIREALGDPAATLSAVPPTQSLRRAVQVPNFIGRFRESVKRCDADTWPGTPRAQQGQRRRTVPAIALPTPSAGELLARRAANSRT